MNLSLYQEKKEIYASQWPKIMYEFTWGIWTWRFCFDKLEDLYFKVDLEVMQQNIRLRFRGLKRIAVLVLDPGFKGDMPKWWIKFYTYCNK